MKLAIYAISKNEEKNAASFMDSVGDIPVYVLDHSTDATAEILKARGAVVSNHPIAPFRFDDAKNFALSMIPRDIEWALNVDLDEKLSVDPDRLRETMSWVHPDSTMVRHLYKSDHEIDRVCYQCRLHRRESHVWSLPIHEWLIPNPCVKQKIYSIDHVLLTQYPSRDRKHTWCDRLLAAVKQYPQESRLRMLCGRDLYFDDRYEDALVQFSEFVSIERLVISNAYDLSYVYAMMARCYNKLNRNDKAMSTLEKACERGRRRESYVDLSHAYMQRGMYRESLEWARKSLKITEGQYAPHSDPGAWGFKPHELISIALYNLGAKIGDAINAAETALEMATGDDAVRISENLKIMRIPL